MKVHVEYDNNGSEILGKIWENNTTEILDVNNYSFINNYRTQDYREYLSNFHSELRVY